MRTLKKQAGITLIEVLIAFLVLGVGLLGVAGLQSAGIKNNHNALLRSHASFLAYELVDYMRTHPTGVQAGDYNIPSGTGNQTSVPPITANCASSPCNNSADIANYNLNRWFQNLFQALPNPSARVACTDIAPTDGINCTPGSLITITINWNESTQSGSTGQSFKTEVEL